MKRKIGSRFGRGVQLSLALLAAIVPRAQAKVVFTGYGDFQADAQGRFTISGPPSVLNTFNLGPGDIEARGSNINALGLFATSQLSDNARVLIDLTFRNIGATTKTTVIQYGYLEYSAYGGQAQAGKITLPFNYYNQNRFYPFQRPSIDGPVFQSAILGLPIADVGASAGRTFDVGDQAAFRADLYAVNGFQSLNGSTTTFRNPGLPGGLTITNNVTGQSANHRVAFGGRLELGPKSLDQDSVGVSYYRDEWDTQGHGLFQMMGAHVHATVAGFDFLTEYLQLDVTNDQGMLTNFGSRNWRTDGFFSELEYKNLSLFSKPVTPWLRLEDYRSHGARGGREALTDYAGGVSIQVLDTIAAKLEATRLYYRLPYVDVGDLALRGYELLAGLTVTF